MADRELEGLGGHRRAVRLPARRRGLLLRSLFPCLAVVVAGALAGCSLIGLGIGSIVDGRNHDRVMLNGWELHRIGIGTRVTVDLRDSREIAGVFGGLDTSPEEYKRRYGAWRAAQAAVGAPVFGDTITVQTTSGKERSGEFQGFEYASLSLLRKGRSAPSQVPYEDIARAFSPEGAAWQGTELAGLAAAGLVPLRPRMLLDTASIPLEQIVRVSAPLRHHGKAIGFLVGAVVDAVVIVAIASTGFSSHEPSPTYSSCPFVYSFDGRRYVQEGDVFPGAIFEASQRSDRLVLQHLVDSDGAYRVRLANELQEIEYLDDVKLLVVDGPEGVSVVPTPGGRFRALVEPWAPRRATDLGGVSVLEQVTASTDGGWGGNPFARDPEDPRRSREGLLLEFPRPTGARAVTIAWRAQPTTWGSRLMREVLALQGPKLPGWYASTEADPAARAEFQRAYRREAQLILRVWAGASWREVGVVDPHEATVLPLDGIPGDDLRLRVDSTAGLWSVDSVLADYSAESPVEVLELSPRVARTQRGEDVADLLERTDGHRHTLRPSLDSVDLVFDPPPPKPGRRRSLVLRASGYYTILAPTTQEERPALFSRLLAEPGMLGQFSLRLAQSELKRRPSQESTLSGGDSRDGR